MTSENAEEEISASSSTETTTFQSTQLTQSTSNNNIGNTNGSGENRKKRKRSRWDQTGSSSKVKDETIPAERGISLTDLNTLQSTITTPTQTMIPNVIADSSSSGTTTTISATTTAATTTTSDITTSAITSTTTSTAISVTTPATTSATTSTTPVISPVPSEKRKFIKYSDTYKPGMVRVGSKWVYPEDEITEGGTWEHKKRAEEMKHTAGQAAMLTSQAEAKRAHHIADFLPKEELEKFEQKVKAVKTGGTTPEYEDYANNKLDQSNIGFKMLMKQGWQAGSGLGKSGEGIAAPINKADSRPENAGLGQTKPEGVEEEDDEFEIYRKRMMLAYRFRPNPLNNPRRPYY
ncbi:hypothetical protein Glove_517g1 [Diversispora epigaea]|uniref:G-patch domain-containing protein n=1 Tax=Diversispora epigaea TaxID=1348612 RepID=A0A397GFE2_9GLOM|nr:hypothetical protein Glove_517g1 [Diversispora epigaea]